MIAAGVACVMASGAADPAVASEGAASYYFAGAFGSFLTAVAPEPGFTAASQTLIFGGQSQRAVLRGRATFGLSASAVYEYLAGSYAFEPQILGGRLQVGAAAPVIATANMNVSLDTRLFGTLSNSATDTGFGDMLLNPFAFYWSFGELHVKLAQWVVAPTGRNYWAFDTQLGITWFHKATGTELTVLPGIMLNTTNSATDYKSGNEFHLDFMANQFLAPTFAIGLQGYWYKQIDGDSGSGTVLGPGRDFVSVLAPTGDHAMSTLDIFARPIQTFPGGGPSERVNSLAT
ncbi:MAG: hypothetical protein EPO55_22795 [Reyranella sp.]|uniref:SphA family protein n=1 Tax=Reyranella sp. TaxID=1929291 RepID=UPI00120697FF|nr:transporter [Reyranella sp.]TAJ36154.1 MAG: hypothetical protein EPO55_22795 [Reyranella sp.]